MTEKSNVQAVHDTLLAEFRRDDRYILLGEDVGVRGGVFRVSDGFIEEFGRDRIIDTPVAESAIVGVAIGAALGGAVGKFVGTFCVTLPVAAHSVPRCNVTANPTQLKATTSCPSAV